jgi:hypothetical protein
MARTWWNFKRARAQMRSSPGVSPALQLRALVDLARALAGACGSQWEMPSGPPPSTIGTAASERDILFCLYLSASAPYKGCRCDPWWAARSFFGQTLAITGYVPFPENLSCQGSASAPFWPAIIHAQREKFSS